MKWKGKSMMSLNEMTEIRIKYEGDGYVTGYPIVSEDDAYILNGIVEANSEYIAIEQRIPIFIKRGILPSPRSVRRVGIESAKRRINGQEIE